MGRLALIFLLLFVSATFVEAFHHHEDGAEHHDCPVCAAAHYHSAAGISIFSVKHHQPAVRDEVPSAQLHYDPIRVAFLVSRAPPA